VTVTRLHTIDQTVGEWLYTRDKDNIHFNTSTLLGRREGSDTDGQTDTQTQTDHSLHGSAERL